MSNILNAVKDKLNKVKQNPVLRISLISVFALLLIFSVTLAWYINNLELRGMEFNTGNIDFDAYVYDKDGNHLLGPVSSNDEDKGKYINAPLALITLDNAKVGDIGTAFIAVKSTGSLGIQYRIAFRITGNVEQLGGYVYNISKVTDMVTFNGEEALGVSGCPSPDRKDIDDPLVNIDRNSVNGMIEEISGYDIYRVDYVLNQKNEDYTAGNINIYFNIFATQIDGDFDSDEEKGQTHYCSTIQDLDRARVEAYPGDTIKLSSDITYYGDLVFNKPINLETNNFTLTVNGNLMYDYVLSNNLKLDAGGKGSIVVQCSKEGIGGNLYIKAPIGSVSLIGSNASSGDFIIENNIIIDATSAIGSPGVSFNEVRIVDLRNSRKNIQLESNTRATVSFNTTIGILQAVAKANNIEIVNNGVIGQINLTGMNPLDHQTNTPQIYVLNNNIIDNPIMLPTWSVKFVENPDGTCSGNTRIIQSFSAGTTEVTGHCNFVNSDIEVERKDSIVEQIEEGNDSRLKIYYQDIEGKVTSIQSILEDYLAERTCSVHEVVQLEIISVGKKYVTIDDITFMNSDSMYSLRQLDMTRANVYAVSNKVVTYDKLPDGAFQGVTKYETLVLPQNLVEIGNNAFTDSVINNVIIIPSGVSNYGTAWFKNGYYVQFAASVPLTQALSGLEGVKAIFVGEAYIDSYRTVYSKYSDRIYPASVMDESKQHFVRNTKNDEWEITYYITGDEPVIGDNITIDGSKLKITSVYDNAYRHHFNGTEVKFVDSVENLGSSNFIQNSAIVKVDLNKIKYVGNDAFAECKGLTEIVISNSLVRIGSRAFVNCDGVRQDIILPETMEEIGAYAFQKTQITALNTGGTISVGNSAFANCTYLVYAELPNVQSIDGDGTNGLFNSCSKLVSVKMPSLKKAGGSLMFGNCTSLRELYMATREDSISLGTATFGDASMAKIKLFVPKEELSFFQSKRPGNIQAIMIYPQGEKLGEELVNGFNIGTYIVSNNGDDTYTLITSNVSHSDVVQIPETFNGKSIIRIYDNAFRNQDFTNVTLKLGNSIQFIGNNAFYERAGLVKVEFGNSLKEIGNSAFYKCTNLIEDIVLPDSMESIGASAFASSAILSINTGGTSTIYHYAFYECKSLVYAIMPEVETILADSTGKNCLFRGCSKLVSVDMPMLLQVNGSELFYLCSSLIEIYFGREDANITLDTLAFHGTSTSRIKVFVPEELLSRYKGFKLSISAEQIFPRGEKLGNKTVNGYVVGDYVVIPNEEGYTLVTSHLTFEGDVVVPNEFNNKPITEIYEHAFRKQTFVDANLILGDNMRVIGPNAFRGVSGLRSVVMDHVTSIGSYAFSQSSIQVLNAPKLTTVSVGTFQSCMALETVSVPRIKNIVNAYVFTECVNLKYIYFEDVMSLQHQVFTGTTNVEKIIINRLINSNLDNMPSKISISAPNCKIYVPYRSTFAYGSTWSGLPVALYDISATHNGDTYILVDNDGRYTLIDYVPVNANATLTLPETLSASEIGEISINSIDEGAFAKVSNTLKELTLSSSVAQLNGSALSECVALENIYVDVNNVFFSSLSGVLYSKDGRMLVKYPAGRVGDFDMTASAYASTVGVGSNAFANTAGLTQIVFSNTLSVIDSNAFRNCSKLHTVEFTGNTPPTLMGAGIFDTGVDDFKMIIPTGNSDVVTAYLSAYNYAEYLPYMNVN